MTNTVHLVYLNSAISPMNINLTGLLDTLYYGKVSSDNKRVAFACDPKVVVNGTCPKNTFYLVFSAVLRGQGHGV